MSRPKLEAKVQPLLPAEEIAARTTAGGVSQEELDEALKTTHRENLRTPEATQRELLKTVLHGGTS